MAYNGSGVFLINSAGQPVVANTVISATVFNALTSDLATGLSTAITKDGQTTITNNIPFGSNKITGLGSGTAAADAANLGQVQSTVAKLITVTGTDTITGSMSPQLTAYAAGQLFYFVANAANTSAVTLNIDSLGAKSITRDGSSALAAGDINSGEVVVVIYDGTRFQMINAANSFGNTTINGTLTVTGNAGFQANVSITSALSVGGVFAVTGAATFTANPTLSGGTANGVLYLNGSKVATSGSALTFDGTGKLGVGTTTPVSGVSAGFEAVGEIWATTASSNSNQIRLSPATSGANIIYSTYSGSGSYLPLAFNVSGSEQMRLTSTGLGIGTTSPAQKLDVVGSGLFTVSGGNQSIILNTSNNAQNYNGLINFQRQGSVKFYAALDSSDNLAFLNSSASGLLTLNSSGNLGLNVVPVSQNGKVFHIDGGAGAADIRLTNNATGSAINNGGLLTLFGSDIYLWNLENNFLSFGTNNSEKARIDASGNLGLGVTPSAWSSAFGPVIQVKTGSGGGALTGSSTDNFRMFANTFYDGSYKRIGAGYATQYEQASGAHAWYTAGTSTAGSTISFTQALTLNANGALVLQGGDTTASGVGITFPATQSASSNANTLDDYEEGTWTGTLKGSTTDPTTPVTATGKYTKIGRQVTVAIYFENVNTTGAAGGVYVTGLPFTEDGTRAVCTCASYNFDFPAGVTSLFGDFSGTAIYGVISGDNGAWADLQHSAGAGRYLRMTGTYFV